MGGGSTASRVVGAGRSNSFRIESTTACEGAAVDGAAAAVDVELAFSKSLTRIRIRQLRSSSLGLESLLLLADFG